MQVNRNTAKERSTKWPIKINAPKSHSLHNLFHVARTLHINTHTHKQIAHLNESLTETSLSECLNLCVERAAAIHSKMRVHTFYTQWAQPKCEHKMRSKCRLMHKYI